MNLAKRYLVKRFGVDAQTAGRMVQAGLTAAIVILAGDDNTIHANTIQGDPTGTNNMVNLTGGANNLVSANMLACTIAQYDTVNSDATSGSWVGNLCTDGPAVAPPV